MRILNRVGELTGVGQGAYDRVLKQNINGMHYFDFKCSSHSPAYKALELEGFIDLDGFGLFTIKEIVTHGTLVTVKCIMSVDGIIGMSWDRFVSYQNNITNAMSLALSGTLWGCDNQSSVTEIRTVYAQNTNAWEIIQRICNVYGVEITFDTRLKMVTLHDKQGNDSGVGFVSKHNLKEIKQDTHTHNLITKLKPIGKDGLTIAEVNGGSEWLTNYTYTDKVMEAVWEQTRYEDASALKKDAQVFLDYYAVPYESYELSIADLGLMSSDYAHHYFGLGDVVIAKDSLHELSLEHRIIYIERHLDNPTLTKINIANKDASFEYYFKRLQLLSESLKATVNEDGTISADMYDANGTGGDGTGSVDWDNIPNDVIHANHIKAESIQTKHLVAGAITADLIQAGAVHARHISAGTIAGSHIQSGAITAGSAIIANGAIGSAQIGTLDAGKITSGRINTSVLDIGSANGRLTMNGETLIIRDATQTRVQIGKDANDDYNMYLVDANGKIMFNASGLTGDGIKSPIIKDGMITDDANISGGKLNIASVINKVNEDGSTQFKASKIYLDTEKQSLSTAFTTMNTTVSGHTTQMANFTTSINGINATVGSLETTTNTLNSKVAQLEVTSNGLTSSVTSINQKVDGMQIGGRNLWIWANAVSGWENHAGGINQDNSASQHQTSKELTAIDPSVPLIVQVWNPNKVNNTGNQNRIAWFDVNKNFISNVTVSPINGAEYYIDTFTPPANARYARLGVIVGLNTIDKDMKVMIEQGTKPTAWTPAPEDVDEKFKDYATTEQLASEIKQTVDSISLTVSSVSNKVDNVKIGGRNTFRKSTDISKLYGDVAISRQYDKYGFTLDTTTVELKHPTPNVTANDTTNQIVGIDTTMEFSFNMSTWTTYNGYNHPDLSTFNGSVYVRTKASGGYLASDIVTLNFNYTASKLPQNPPSVSADDTNNIIVNYDTSTMQYSFDNSTWENGWYPSLATHNGDIWVRLKETTTHNASASVKLSFTYSKPQLSPPNVSADDNYNDILGITTEMEFSTNTMSWTTYDGSNLGFLEIYNGNVYVRYKATATHSASNYVTLTFTYTSSGGSFPYWTYDDSLTNTDFVTFKKTHASKPMLERFAWIGFVTDSGYSTDKNSTINSADYNSATKITTVRLNKDWFSYWSDSWNDDYKADAFEQWLSSNNIVMYEEPVATLIDDIEVRASAGVRLNKVITKNGEWSISGNVKASADGVMEIDFCDKSQQSIPVTTSFTRFECTGTVDNYTDAIYNFIDIACNSKLIFEEVMIENGNKCSNFVPPAEDIDDKFKDYDTTEVLESKIAQTARDIALSVSGTYYTKDEGKATENRLVTAESSIKILSNSITNKVEENGVKSIIQQSPEDIRIGFNKVSDRIVFSNAGMTIKGGGMTIKNDAGKSAFEVDSKGNVTLGIYDKLLTISATGTRGHTMHADVNDVLYMTCSSANAGSGINIRSDNGNGLFEWHPYNSTNGTWGYVNMATWTRISSLSVLNDCHISKNFTVSGTKNCIQETENYGKRKLNAYETPDVYFGDLGEAVIEDWSVRVDIDPIFQECIEEGTKYHVFTQCYTGNITKIERFPTHFIVSGETGTEFSWELKAKRKGFEDIRLEEYKDIKTQLYGGVTRESR